MLSGLLVSKLSMPTILSVKEVAMSQIQRDEHRSDASSDQCIETMTLRLVLKIFRWPTAPDRGPPVCLQHASYPTVLLDLNLASHADRSSARASAFLFHHPAHRQRNWSLIAHLVRRERQMRDHDD